MKFKRACFAGTIAFVCLTQSAQAYSFQIFVRTFGPTGKTYVVDVDGSDSIENVKSSIERQSGIPVRKQRLFYAASELEDGRNLWDYNIQNESLILLELRLPGVAATRTALTRNRDALRALMVRRITSLSQTTDYDCSTFGPSGWCIAFMARGAAGAGDYEGAGVITLAASPTPKTRFGGFLEVGGPATASGGVSTSSGAPIGGLFLGYGDLSGAGLQTKASVAFGAERIQITRAALESAEQADGRATLAGLAVAGQIGWGFAAGHGLVVTPYIGLRLSEMRRAAYSENKVADVTEYPITYDPLSLKLGTAFAGISLNASVTDRLAYQVKIAAEYDYLRKDSGYAGSSESTDLERFSMSSASNQGVRAVGSLALHYRLSDGHRLIGYVNVRGQAFNHDPLLSTLFGYQVSF